VIGLCAPLYKTFPGYAKVGRPEIFMAMKIHAVVC
jgi:hypothetical protein